MADDLKKLVDWETYYKYAKAVASKYLSQKFNSIPLEIREEMLQEAMIRAMESYKRLDPNKSWRSFCYTNVVGAVIDYSRAGKGFSEHKSSVTKNKIPQLKSRVTKVMKDGERVEDIDYILGSNGVFDDDNFKTNNINWDLLSRMARHDHIIHIVAKVLLGFTFAELQKMFDLTGERLCQKFDEFIKSLDDPKECDNKWLHQAIYALGLCDIYGIKNEDLGLGWNYEPVDLYEVVDLSTNDKQLNLMDLM